MFKICIFGGLTVIPGRCGVHPDCTEYSVVPDDPAERRYALHSAGPNAPTDGLTMEELEALLQSQGNFS
jgi:hypothetical protein